MSFFVGTTEWKQAFRRIVEQECIRTSEETLQHRRKVPCCGLPHFHTTIFSSREYLHTPCGPPRVDTDFHPSGTIRLAGAMESQASEVRVKGLLLTETHTRLLMKCHSCGDMRKKMSSTAKSCAYLRKAVLA